MKITNDTIRFGANKVPKNQAKYFEHNLTSKPNIDIICHETTDKDGINSALAMANLLETRGINARIVLSQDLKALDIIDKNKTLIQAKNFTIPSEDSNILCVDFSSSERISQNILDYINSSKNVYCIDHHKKPNLANNFTLLTEGTDTQEITTTNPFYIDTTAKSATSVVYRLYEALNEDIDNKTAYELFSGLASDCYKNGLIESNGKKGTITPSDEFIKNKNAYEIYLKLKNQLSNKQISKIAKNIDIMANLTDEEEKFYTFLTKNIKFSPKNKIAYVAIAPDDLNWKNIGEDNPRTSGIMNCFRRNMLKRYPNIQTIITFYKAENNYRLSIHSKNDNLEKLYKMAEEKIDYDNFTIGGHKSRGGGKITSLDKDKCSKFVQDIVELNLN